MSKDTELFAVILRVDENKTVGVFELADGAFMLEGSIVEKNMMSEKYRGSRIVFTREAMVELRDIINMPAFSDLLSGSSN